MNRQDSTGLESRIIAQAKAAAAAFVIDRDIDRAFAATYSGAAR